MNKIFRDHYQNNLLNGSWAFPARDEVKSEQYTYLIHNSSCSSSMKEQLLVSEASFTLVSQILQNVMNGNNVHIWMRKKFQATSFEEQRTSDKMSAGK